MTHTHKTSPEPVDHLPTRMRRLPFPLGQTVWVETAWTPGHELQDAYATAWALRPWGKGPWTKGGPRPTLAVVELVPPDGVRYQYALTFCLGGRFLHEGETTLVSSAMILVRRELFRHVTMGTYWHAWGNLRRPPPLTAWPS